VSAELYPPHLCVTRAPESPEGEHHFRAQLDPGWNIGPVPNGGYSGSLVLRSILEVASDPDPLTVTAHYLRPVFAGDMNIVATQLRQGRTQSMFDAIAFQNDKEVIRMRAVCGDLSAITGPTTMAMQPEELPLSTCVRRLRNEGETWPPEFYSMVDIRLGPTVLDLYSAPDRVHDAVVDGWIRHLDPVPTHGPDIFLFADGFPPPIFMTGYGPGRVPTIELTVHFRARPVTNWIQARFSSASISNGLLTEDGELWDQEGNLVALSRQLALAPPLD